MSGDWPAGPGDRPARILVLAKAPVAGRVKTRLCPPCTPEQAAAIAAAALADTIDVVTACAADRILVLDGRYPVPAGWAGLAQRGAGLGARLANAFADAAGPAPAGPATLLVGMDTPQLTPADLGVALRLLVAPGGPDAVLGLAEDGGWWTLGLRDPSHAAVLRDIVTSTATTGAETRSALRRRGLSVHDLAVLSDVDTADDARRVAARCPSASRFARAVDAHVPDIAGVSR